MRICLVTAFPPSRERLNEYGFHLARELSRDPALSVTVLADELEAPQPERDGFDVQRCWRFNSLASGPRILRSLKELQPDVVWFNLVFSSFGDRPVPAFAGLCLPTLARLRGCYTHVTLHHLMEGIDLAAAQVSHAALYRAAGVLATHMLLRANGVSVLLPAYRKTLVSKYHAGNVHLRPHGIFSALPEFPDFTRRNQGEQRILAFGKWGTYKRVDILLEAFDRIKAQCPRAKLVIAGGDHPLTPGYTADLAARYAGSPDIEFTGYVPEENIAELFAGASMLVLPYTSAGGPSGVAHQACQFGVPMVSADVPLFRGMAEEEDMAIDFYRTGDAAALGEVCVRLLQDETRQREMAEQNFSVALRMTMPAVIRQYVRGFDRQRTLRHRPPFRRGLTFSWRVRRHSAVSSLPDTAVAAAPVAPMLTLHRRASALRPFSCSVIIPAFNEAERITPTLQSVGEYLESLHGRGEIIVVNDGSTDSTAEVVRQCSRHHRIRLISYRENRGKGHAVRMGLQQARGDYALLCDADGSIPIEEADKLFLALQQGADIAIGSRWLDSAMQTLPQPPVRRLAGRCFNLLVRRALKLDFADTQCGFKAFSRVAADLVTRGQRVERWAFDPELLLMARKFGLTVTEVPVVCYHDNRSHIHLLHDSAVMLRDTLCVAFRDRAGAYEPERYQARERVSIAVVAEDPRAA